MNNRLNNMPKHTASGWQNQDSHPGGQVPQPTFQQLHSIPSHLQACLEPEGQTMRLKGKSWGLFGGNPSGSAQNDAGHRYWLKVKVLVAQSCPTLSATPWAVASRLLCPWNSPGKNTGVSSHSLLQGIFTGYRAEFCFFSHLLLAPTHTHVPFPSSSPRKELTDLWWWKIPNWGFVPGRWRVGILAALLFGPDLLAPSGPLPSGHNPSVCPLATGLLFGAFSFSFFWGWYIFSTNI